jgi:hypothetical protein|uniref:Type I restriction enzyme n=1 Tax=Podoviridae sp. ctzXp5 TaxID=2827758 RepID=A0A8S5TE94_9CAUD|nr:MAG TPA: Type I restriction enzyme [Podoviridae sp. ctzXp5]
MARYKYNDKLYDIPEEVVDKFESMYPDAVTRFSVEDDVYEIPVSRKRDFLGTFKNATPYEDFSSLDNPEHDNDFDDTDYVSQSSQNPPPIALRQEFDVTKPDQSEYVNPLTNSPDYNFESLRKKGKIETVKPNDKFGLISESINENRIGLDDEISNAMRGNVPEGIRPIDVTTNLISARNYLNEADDLIKARKEGGGVLRGMRDAASKLGTWDFGTSDLAANKSVYNALRKFERGEELSQDELRLLDAVAVNTAAKVYASDLGVSYDIGSGFVQSIPFMLEMIVNPLSGAGKGVGKALAGYAAKRFGGKVIPKVAGVAGRVVGDIAASTGMAATTGAAGVAADTYSRMIGSPVYTDVGRVSLGQEVRDLDTGEVLRDENGNPVKVGSVGKESIGSALYKSLASRSIDNFSEMFGSYFGPVGDILKETKAGKKISASALVNSMNKLTTADWTKGFNKIMQDAKYDGFFGETAEEYVGGLLNAAIVGDQSLEDLGSLDNLLQTAGTVGLMSGILGSVNLIGLRGVRYNARKGLERSEANGRKVFGDDFDVLKDELMNMDPDKRKDVVRDMIASDRFNMEQKKAIMDYFYRRSVYDGLANGESKKMDEATQAETEAIESESNPETGLYIEASRIDPLTKQLTPGTIVQGMMEDGKDRVMWKGPDGKVEMILKSEIDPSSVRSMQTQEIIDVSVNNIRESMRAEIERDSKYDPSIPSPEETIGQSFYVDGNPYAFFNENGRLNPYLVDLNGKPIKPVRNISVEDYYQAKQAEIDKQKVVQNSPVYKLSDGRIARLIDMDESDVALEILDRDGNPVGNISMTKEDFDNNASMQEQSPYERYVDTGDVDDSVVNLIADKISRGDALTPEEESMRQGASDRVESRLSDIRDQSLKEAETLNVTESISQSSNQGSEVPLDNQEPTGDIKPSVVMKEDGTPNFVSSGVDATLDFLHDKYGEKMPKKIEVTRKAFDEDLKKASEKLDKAQEAYDNAPIGKEDKVEAALIKARQEYDAIKVEADFWANLDDDIKEASKKPGDVIAKEISVMGDPMSGEELAAMMLANGAIKLTRDTYKKETGAGNNETARMFGLFASPEKGGVNIERAGEILELADKENGTNFFDENDTNAGRDAIIEVLSSAHTRGDLIDYVKRNREAIAERERQAEYNAYAEWCEENYQMSPEEYEAYEEGMVRDFSEKQLTDEERGELDSQIVDEIQAIIDEQNEIDAILAQNKPIENENIEGNDESGGDGLREGGGEVLPREQLDQTGGTGEVEGRESAGPDIDRTDGATQEGSSRGLVPFVAPSPKESENPLDYAERIVEAKRLHDEELKVNTNPSEAQKEAGNYKKGHIKINGFDVTIEQPAGSVRSGKDANGKEWSVTMNNTYGYIRGTESVDGDHIDVFLGPDMNSDMVYVVDQVNTDGSFDEHKVMMGFSSLEDARSAYLSNYGEGWQGLGNITGVALDEFKKWIDSSIRKTKPFSEYKGIKREEDIAPRKVKKLSLVDKDDYITSAERKHIKAFLESGLKEARVNNSIYEISNIGDDGVYEIVRRFNYTDPLTLVKDENGKLVNKRGEGEHVIRVKPTFEEIRPDSGIRFREVKDKNGEKSLVGLHNISEEKLRKALRQGGFANPSAAVIDISRQSHTGYGSISLVLPSSMIEKRTGKNAGTWSQDAWTPIYPTIERQFSGKGSDAFSKDLQKLPEEMRSTTKSGMDSYMDGRGEDSLAYMYLYEQGKAPEIARTKPSYPEKTRTEVEDATNGSFSMSGLSDKQLSRLKDAYMEYKGFSTEGYNEAIKLRRAKLEEAIGKMNPRSILYEKRKTDLERIDKYGFDYSAVESFMKSVRDDISNSDKVDAHGTMRDSWNFIEENGMRGDFNKWLDKLNERYGIKEIIFNGFTPSGIRKYIPNTLENVSKFMKKQGRSASVGIGASFQNFAASLLDAKGSLKDIRKDKGKLTTDHADVDAFRDKWSKVFHELGEKLQPDAKGYDDYGLYRLAEAARSKDPQKYIKEEYGIDFSDEDVKTLNEMVDAIRNEYPAMYFETKFERPVYLEEFAAAVVPDNVDGDIRKAIYDAGLKIFTYKADDEISRNEAVKQASEIDGVRFRSIGDKGAANLNNAETIESSINDWSNKLNTPVRVIHDVDDITDTDENMLARKRDSKGWYDTSTGEIVIVSPNSTSVGDAQRTFLHEVVGHHGLRELFGDDFDTFLDNVYRNANEDIRKNIIDRTKGNPLNLREATEEYLAELAERGFDNKAERSLWEKIKDSFLDMLRKAGISLDFKLSDNDLRYILWRSYKNLEQGNLMDVAEDTVMRNDLGIGDFSVRFREEEKEDINDLKKKNYRLNKKVDRLKDKIDELHSDSQLSEALKNELINEIQSRIDSKDASNINKEDLLSLLKQVKGAKTKADMEDKMLEVDRISNEIRIRSTQRRIDRLLALKTQDVNGKNMSIAKNVDDITRRVFDFIRGSLSDIKISGYEQEMKDLRRRNRELTTLIEARGRMTEDTGLSGDDRRSASEDIVSFKKEMEDNKVRISELKNMAEDVRNAKANDLMGELEHMRKELEDKLNEAAEGKAVWSIEDSERKMALDILGISLDARDYEGAVNSINRDIMEKVRNNSSFYAAQMNRIRSMENPTEQKEARKNMKAGYNENKRRIRAEKRLLNETLRSRLEVLDNIESLLNELVEGGRAALSRKTEEETYRRIDIVRNSIEDVADKPVDINNKDLGKMNWFKKFASSPLGSFDYMAQRVGRKFLNGDGYIYQRFVKGQEGTIAAENELAKNRDRFRKTFANKVNEIFNEDADSVLSDSNKRVEKSGVYIINTDTEGEYGRKIEIPMTKGEAMYVYMVWKMDDGRMKLEQQGFTDDSLLEIEDFIGENYKAFADWIQDDLLVNLRDRYNERYVDMYGTSMANIPNYAPLRINKNAVMNEVDLEEVRKGKKTLEEKANSLIKRTVNSKPIDLSTNGIEAVISHVRDMEEWYAFARVRRDLSWLLSSPTFRNKVNSNVNGHYVDFVDAAALASHSYHPDPDKYADEFFAKVNRGLVGANISFGLMTAAKQILSLPAFLGYSQSPKFMVAFTKNIGLGFTGRPYKWAMENMPMFYERVKDGNLGDEKLRDDGDNLGKIIESYLKIGMVPNKMIDAFTISVGAKSVYDYTYDKLRKGYERLSDDEAKRQALVDAEIFFNQTQQSGVETFLSPMQRSRTIINRMLTTYQNSNIGYVRRVMLSLYDLASLKDWSKLRSNYAERFKAEGMDDDTANQKAQSLLLNGARKQLFHFLLFGWGMNMLWDLGSSGFFGFFAGDDDEDEKYKDIVKFVTTPVKGVPAGNIINNLVDGYDINPVLFLDELQRAYNNIGSSIDDIGMDPLLAMDVLSNGSKLVGFDMERWGNIYLGMEGLIRNQGKEGYLLQDIMFLLNTPKSQRVKVAREMYKNEPFLDYAEKVSRAYRYTPMSNKWEYWVPGTDILTRSKLNKIKRNYVEDNMTSEQKAQDKERKEKEKEIRRIRELSIDKEAMERFVNK